MMMRRGAATLPRRVGPLGGRSWLAL